MNFVDADDDSRVADGLNSADPIIGWLILSELDDSVLVYDADGLLEGEILNGRTTAVWVPAADRFPPSQVGGPPNLTNPHLQDLVDSVLAAGDTAAALEEVIGVLRSGFWATEPGQGYPERLTAFLGQPLGGRPNARHPATPRQPHDRSALGSHWTDDDGGIDDVSFPVVFGSASLDDDGVALVVDPFRRGRFLSPYAPSAGTTVVAGTIPLTVDTPVAVTAVLHPYATVHVFSGILPPTRSTLPRRYTRAPFERMEADFRVGPVVTPAGAVAMPAPAFGTGPWGWLQYQPDDSIATVRPVVDAASPRPRLTSPRSSAKDG